MNPWLAKVYGTGGAQGDDLEKVAQSMLLQKLAEAEGIDLNTLSPEQIEALAAEVVPDEGAEVEGVQPGMVAQAGEGASEEEAGEEEITKEAQAKFEEADFLGRVMAHSYTQELQKIAGFGSAAKSVGEKAKHVFEGAKHHGGNLLHKGKEMGGKAVHHVKEHKGAYGAGAGAGAAGFGAGRMSKEASSPILEKLAQIRAQEILAENGIDPATGQPAQAATPAQQVAQPVAPEQQVQAAVNDRAVEILKEAGYRFQ